MEQHGLDKWPHCEPDAGLILDQQHVNGVGRTGNSRLWDLAARHLAEWTPRKLRFTYPNDKRKYGYYVLPILHEGKVVGRVDPLMDRAKGVLHIHRVHAEPGAPMNRKTDKAIAQAIAELGAFLSARHINIENKA